MSERLQVWLSTVSTSTDAQRLARDLVSRELAACVNIVPGVQSIYHWQGELCDDQEWLLVIKAPAAAAEALKTHIQAEHPYDQPELIALDVQDGLPGYLDWALKR